MDYSLLGSSLPPWDSPDKSTGVGCHFLLPGIFLTQGSNPGLLHCRQILLLSEPPGKYLPAPPRPQSKPEHPSDSCKRLLDSPLNGSQTGLLRGAHHQQGAAGREPEPGPPRTGPRGGERRWGGQGRSSPQLPDGEDLWPHAGPGAPWSVPRGPGTGQLPPLGTGSWATAGTLLPRHRAVCSRELASWGQQPCLATSIKRPALRPQKQASA